MPPLYQQVLLFPDRAENLGRFSDYKVRFEHWHPLSAQFKACFRDVYERGNAAILLIHGEQGAGKTLFARRLQDDFQQCREGKPGTVRDNLWHALVGEPEDPSVVRSATAETAVKTIHAKNGWLEQLRTAYATPEHRARVFIADDAHKSDFLRTWAGLSQEAFLNVGSEAALPAVAERMVELCRTDFCQSVFVLFSARSSLMNALHQEIEKTHRGLSHPIELPLPEASIKEEIVRQNTNSLNPYSYWYCLDGAGPKGKEGLYGVLHQKRGFTDTFRAVDEALKRTVSRSGRPANQNLLTLCTLGSTPAEVGAFISAQELPLDPEYVGDHIAVWSGARISWASALVVGSNAELARRAKLLESEFAFRWVALGPLAISRFLKPDSAVGRDQRLLEVLSFAPSVAKPDDATKVVDTIRNLDQEISTADDAEVHDAAVFMSELRDLGQRRSTLYEPALQQHYPGHVYGRGFEVFSTLRPDVILEEYVPCAIAETTGKTDAITRAIARRGRVIEFTSFLNDGLNGLDAYLRTKIEAYARMLESV